MKNSNLQQQIDRDCPLAMSVPYIYIITKYSLITNYKTGIFSIFGKMTNAELRKSPTNS